MRTRTLTTLLLGAALAAGCGDGTGPGDPLTRAEAARLHAALFAMGAGIAEGEFPGLRPGAGADVLETSPNPNAFAYEFEQTEACAPSGSVRVQAEITGSMNPETQDGHFSADLSVAHDDCAVPTEGGGVFTLTGDPDIDVTLEATSAAGVPTSLVLTEKGAFTWENGAGNAGRCTLDVTAELVAATGEVQVSGTFCGFPVDESFVPER
ncbi:MAG TPA: hypothetical protein VHG91_19665 [Longimicrobium sp.]|nr:hypothetical protein [Longimicrobium sp.]